MSDLLLTTCEWRAAAGRRTGRSGRKPCLDIWETSKLPILGDWVADLLDDLLAMCFFCWRSSHFSCCLLLSFAIDRGLMMIDN